MVGWCQRSFKGPFQFSLRHLALHVATCLSSQGEVLLHHAERWNWPGQKDGIGPGRRMELARAEGWNWPRQKDGIDPGIRHYELDHIL